MSDPERTTPGSTTAQLKDDINSGRTGDKVSYPDLAAAPLGTDDEAAGTTARPAEVDHARAQENIQPSVPSPENQPPGPLMRYWPFALVALVALAALIVVGR